MREWQVGNEDRTDNKRDWKEICDRGGKMIKVRKG
jgi:hypothetical protein